MISETILPAAKAPLGILCFNRWEYAEQCAESLRKLRGIHERQVLIYQDGAVNEVSGLERASASDLDRVRDAFLAAVPHAQFIREPSNVGIALATRTAWTRLFETGSPDAAYLIEDDVVLSPVWLEVMDWLASFAQQEERVGFFSASGAPGLSREQQAAVFDELGLESYWLRATGQTRVHFQATTAFLDPFYSVIQRCDYSVVPDRVRVIDEGLAGWFHSLQSRPGVHSQDAFRDWSSHILGFVNVHTAASWLRYVGEHGVNGNPEQFEEMRYRDTAIMESWPGVFRLPQRQEMNSRNAAWLEVHRLKFQEQSDGLRSILARQIHADPGAWVSAAPPTDLRSRDSLPGEGWILEMPAAERELLTTQLQRARTYLEFGSGGSTALAVQSGTEVVVSVESDLEYVHRLTRDFAEVAGFHCVHADVGPTKGWGYPEQESMYRKFPGYAGTGWALLQSLGREPELILIDGRFRVACFLVSFLLAPPGCVILFDDYRERPNYHVVEAVAGPPILVGRMAVFVKSSDIGSWPHVNRVEWIARLLPAVVDAG